MNIRNIDLNLLHIFVVVYDCRSITQAAKLLHLSQPAVSNAITRLNNALNLTLFVKNSRNIIPTDQADKIYKDIKSSLQKIESSLFQQIHFDPALSERIFRLATTNYGELALFPKLIPYLKEHAPNIKITREFLPKSGFSKKLQESKFDLALFLDRPAEKGIQKELLFDDTLVLISGPQHPKIPENPSIDVIAGLDLISFGNEYDEHDPLLKILRKHPRYRPPRFTLTTLLSALHMVSCSTLTTVAPLLIARMFEKQMQLNIHPLNDSFSKIKLNLYWRDIDTTDPSHIWFRGLVKDIFADYLTPPLTPLSPEPCAPSCCHTLTKPAGGSTSRKRKLNPRQHLKSKKAKLSNQNRPKSSWISRTIQTRSGKLARKKRLENDGRTGKLSKAWGLRSMKML